MLLPLPGSNLDRPVVQPVARHYTAWATRLTLFVHIRKNYTAILLSFQRATVCISPKCPTLYAFRNHCSMLGILQCWPTTSLFRMDWLCEKLLSSATVSNRGVEVCAECWVFTITPFFVLKSDYALSITVLRLCFSDSHDYVLSAARLCALNWGFSAQRGSFYVCVVYSVAIMFSFWSTATDLYTH
jgi:hypothetical protein